VCRERYSKASQRVTNPVKASILPVLILIRCPTHITKDMQRVSPEIIVTAAIIPAALVHSRAIRLKMNKPGRIYLKKSCCEYLSGFLKICSSITRKGANEMSSIKPLHHPVQARPERMPAITDRETRMYLFI
jgi:hypothetical protein